MVLWSRSATVVEAKGARKVSLKRFPSLSLPNASFPRQIEIRYNQKQPTLGRLRSSLFFSPFLRS